MKKERFTGAKESCLVIISTCYLLITVSIAVAVEYSQGVITGTIIDSSNKQPLAGVAITAYDSDSTSRDEFIGRATTDTSGKYVIRIPKRTKQNQWDGPKTSLHTQWRPDIYIVTSKQGYKSFKSKVYSDHMLKNNLRIDSQIQSLAGVQQTPTVATPNIAPTAKKLLTPSVSEPSVTTSKTPTMRIDRLDRREPIPEQLLRQPTLRTQVVPRNFAQVDDNTYTITDNATGGDCIKLGEDYKQKTGIDTLNAKWDNVKKECEVHSMTIYEEKTVNINSGTILRTIAGFGVMGTINNHGQFIVGGFPRKADSGFTVGGTLLIRPTGVINNESGATLNCFTNSYVENYGQINNQGAIDFDCKVELKFSAGNNGGLLVNNGTLMIDKGTMMSNGYPSRTIHDGNLWLEQYTSLINHGSIYQRKNSYGEKNSVVNRGLIENFNYYNMSGGTIRNWGKFYNICSGVAEAMNIVEGNPVENKPCDKDGDGIPDVVDQCPNDKEIFNDVMDNDGCPDAIGSSSP